MMVTLSIASKWNAKDAMIAAYQFLADDGFVDIEVTEVRQDRNHLESWAVTAKVGIPE